MPLIIKPEQHEIDRAGKRLLRDALESLGWVVNKVEEDYGIDFNVQVFDGKSPTGTWFHVQLKSSASSEYAADASFVSQELSIDHARHYALEMRQPVFLIHADVISKQIYWHAPQVDHQLTILLGKTGAKFIRVRIPTEQQLPGTAPDLLTSLDTIYLALGSRELTSASNEAFVESVKHLPDQERLHRAFRERTDTLRLRKIGELFRDRKWSEARPRAEAILGDPDSTIEIKFWARIQLEGIDFATALHAGKSESELHRIPLTHAKALQQLTSSGPKYLKFFSIIARHAAELEILVHENASLFMALHQHLEQHGDPMIALSLYVRKAAHTKRIVSKYNQCVRLARYAAHYPDRWMLGRAVARIINAIGPYLITLRSEKNFQAEQAFSLSALQLCKAAASISAEAGDSEGLVLAILSALMTTHSEDSDACRWSTQGAQTLVDPALRAEAFDRIERAKKRWRGERLEGDYYGDAAWQIIEKIASALCIDLNDKKNAPLVRGLRIAAKDNNPERVLARCEHIIATEGATGPTAREIWRLFNTTRAASKVVHCTLHNFHVEGKDFDAAYTEFKRAHCDSCPDQKPRPEGWRHTKEEEEKIQRRHREFVASLVGSPYALRYTDED
jgi:hypothetical protein